MHPDVPVQRTRFSAITKGEIERAFDEMGHIDECLAAAGASRQDIDLMWGAVLTRYLTLANQTVTKRPFGDVLSAGRVQTPTLKLIVDREKERDAFVPETYWQVRADLAAGEDEFTALHATSRFSDEEARARRRSRRRPRPPTHGHRDLRGDDASARRTRRRRSTRPPCRPPPPRRASRPRTTMRVAESLYMDGLISYPRVDNTVYPPSLDLGAMLDTLSARGRVPRARSSASRSAPLHPTRGKKETTDHPPIHPTGAADADRLVGAGAQDLQPRRAPLPGDAVRRRR